MTHSSVDPSLVTPASPCARACVRAPRRCLGARRAAGRRCGVGRGRLMGALSDRGATRVLAAIAIVGVAAFLRVDAAEASYREAVTRFDADAPLLHTDLSGDLGVLNGDSAEASLDAAGGRPCLRLDWRFDGADDYTGLWMSLRGPSAASWVSLDLTQWDAIALHVWGRPRLVAEPVSAGEGGCTLKVEVKDVERRYEGTAYCYVHVDPGPAGDWNELRLPTDLGDGSVWRLNAELPDTRRAKELVLVVEDRLNPDAGALRFGGVELVGADRAAPVDDDAFLELVEGATFRFFRDYPDPATGLCPDQSWIHGLNTTAGTGFALAALCVGAERGRIERDEAAARARRTLSHLLGLPMGDAAEGMAGNRGFFYHFLDSEGRRRGQCELSTVDTALLMLGVLACRGCFDGPAEADIRETATALLRRVEWSWMLAEDGLFRHGWTPESGFLGAKWDVYTDELLLLNLVALVCDDLRGEDRIPIETFWAWTRFPVRAANGEEFIASYPGALFTYTFASAWLPRSALDRPDAHPTQPVNWWANSAAAARANHAYCRARPETYGPAAWGLTACAGRVGSQSVYHPYGAPPCLEVRDGTLRQRDKPHQVMLHTPDFGLTWVDDNTVIATYGAASALGFLPEEAIRDLRWRHAKSGLWREADCGFGDAYAETDGWRNQAVFSIDAGPMLLAIDNYRSSARGEVGVAPCGVLANPEVARALAAIARGPEAAPE